MVNGRTSGAMRQVCASSRTGRWRACRMGVLGRFVGRRDEAAFEAALGPARADGPERLPPGPARSRRRGGCLPGNVPGPGLQGGHVPGRRIARSVALPGREPGRGPCAGRTAGDVAIARSRGGAPGAVGSATTRTAMEVPRVVQEELARLPERLRAPFVLCYLEGMTHELAARELRCPVGTVRSRLARARALLHRRIARRGIATPSAALAAVLESSACASAVPPHLPRSLVKLATRFASGSASIGGGSGRPHPWPFFWKES